MTVHSRGRAGPVDERHQAPADRQVGGATGAHRAGSEVGADLPCPDEQPTTRSAARAMRPRPGTTRLRPVVIAAPYPAGRTVEWAALLREDPQHADATQHHGADRFPTLRPGSRIMRPESLRLLKRGK